MPSAEGGFHGGDRDGRWCGSNHYGHRVCHIKMVVVAVKIAAVAMGRMVTVGMAVASTEVVMAVTMVPIMVAVAITIETDIVGVTIA